MRPRVARLLDELLGLDHLLDPRPPRVVGDVDDVDPRRAESGHDQVRAIRPVARRAAAVPAEVMQLVADVRHRRLVDDPAVLGIDHGEEVGRAHPGALVQAGQVEELLRRCLMRLLPARRGTTRVACWSASLIASLLATSCQASAYSRRCPFPEPFADLS